MLFCNIDMLDAGFEYRRNQFVGIKNDTISYIGATEPTEDFGERYDGSGKVLMPGLVNAHTHVPMTLLRGYAENLPLANWLNDKVFPFEAKITDESARPATDLAIAEMLRFGTVSFTDMYYFEEARLGAVLDSGIKANLSHGLISLGQESYKETGAYAINEMLVKDYHGAGNGRIKIDFCLHAEYTNTEPVAREIAACALEHGVNMHIHLSETRSEHEECKGRHNGMTPTEFFAECGVFDVPTTAAHCVYLEGDDFAILHEKGATVATCPASNMKLSSGCANTPAMLESGINLALGSDGVASNNNHNLFKDMYLMSLLPKGFYEDPTMISSAQALTIATLNGAVSQGRTNCGVISLGNKADLIVLDTSGAHMSPSINPLNNLVYSSEGSDVCLTMVDGAVLYRDGEFPTIDVERARYETQAATDAIRASL